VDRYDGFNKMYLAIDGSRVYREAVRASANGLPDWLVPFSTINAGLLERFATELDVKRARRSLIWPVVPAAQDSG